MDAINENEKIHLQFCKGLSCRCVGLNCFVLVFKMVGFKRSAKSMTTGNEPKKGKEIDLVEEAPPKSSPKKSQRTQKTDDTSDFEEQPVEKEKSKFK